MKNLLMCLLAVMSLSAFALESDFCGEGSSEVEPFSERFYHLAEFGLLRFVVRKDVVPLNFDSPKDSIRFKELGASRFGDVIIDYTIRLSQSSPSWRPAGYRLLKGHSIEISGFNRESGEFRTRNHEILHNIKVSQLIYGGGRGLPLHVGPNISRFNKHFIACDREVVEFSSMEAPKVSTPLKMVDSDIHKMEFDGPVFGRDVDANTTINI